MVTVRAARRAMATRFEVVLNGEKESWLQSVAEEVLDEIEKLEAKLSLYNPASQIARINHQAAVSPVKLDPLVFGLLQRCKTLSEKTNGAFDITMGPLIKCWGFMKGTGECPSEDAIARAMNLVGMQHVHLDPTDYTVRFDKEGVMLDLGAVGKGYALEVASEILLDFEIKSGIIHGGTSTISAIGTPPEDDAWHIALIKPESDPAFPYYVEEKNTQTEYQSQDLLTVVPLVDQSLSVSAIWGKSFQSDDRTLGHVIDGRTGQPAQGHWIAGLVCGNTTDSDALSTAMLVDGFEAINAIQSIHPQARWLLVNQGQSKSDYDVHLKGLTLKSDELPQSKA